MSSTTQTPPLMTAHGDGDISLFYAAEWIATQKLLTGIDSGHFCFLESAYVELRAVIVSGKIAVTGIKRDEANYVETEDSEPRDIVPGHRFSDCAIQCPYHTTDFDLAFGNHSWLLRSFAFEDQDDWNNKFSDALLNRSQKGWVQLKVLKCEILKRWPDRTQAKRGAGRPTMMPAVIAEHAARLQAGKAMFGLGEESRFLETWFADTYRDDKKPLKAGSIENAIRDWRKSDESH